MPREEELYYKALVKRDTSYEGVFFYAVTTTGTFCRPSCPSRKPRFENCRFYKNIELAKAAHYRPCLRCNPLTPLNALPAPLKKLFEQIKKSSFDTLNGIDPSKFGMNPKTLSRQFKKHFGQTYIQYLKKHQIDLAIDEIKGGRPIIDIQLSLGYESSSGFRAACYRYFGKAPSQLKKGQKRT